MCDLATAADGKFGKCRAPLEYGNCERNGPQAQTVVCIQPEEYALLKVSEFTLNFGLA